MGCYRVTTLQAGRQISALCLIDFGSRQNERDGLQEWTMLLLVFCQSNFLLAVNLIAVVMVLHTGC